MGLRGRWGVRVAIALCAGAGVWLLVTALRDGWGRADPVASVFGSVAGLAALVLALRAVPAPRPPVPRPVPPEVPEWWVDRDEADAVIRAVRRRTHRWRSGGSVAITAGLHGAGGFGKTTLAKYVAAQRSVQRRFPGGVHLVTIGQDVRGRAAVAAKVAEETRLITGDTVETGSDPERAGNHLGSLLAQRPRTLLVIDDVWEHEQLAPFLRGAPHSCVRLVTTRKPEVLPRGAVRIEVDRMTEQQAQRLLTDRLPAVPQWDVVQALVKATGRWALLLGIANKFIAEQAATGADPTIAARALLERLRAGGPAAQDPDATLDLSDPERRNTAVKASIKASTTLLQPDDAEARFAELGIFAEDEAVPMALVVALWQGTSGREETATRSLCKQMADLSLLHLDKTVPGGTLTLHDVVRDYLRAQLGIAGLQAASAALLDSLAPTLPHADDGVAWWQTTIGYLQDHLIEHLLDAGRAGQAQATAEDFRWIRARLHQRGPTAPWRDLDRIGPPARSLARQLSRAANLLAPTNPPHALDAILRSRITDAPNWPTTPLPGDPPALINRWPPPDLPDPALLRTLTNHTSVVNGVAFSPDGAALATAGGDGTVRIWDPTTGQELRTLTGHTNGVTALAMSPDGSSLATTNIYRSVQIWDPATGQELSTLTGHTNEVTAAAFSPDGSSLATTSFDGTVRIWDPTTGQELRTLTGHTNGVTALAFSPDGSSLATTSNDQTVRIWDLALLEVPQTSSTHTGPACAVVVSSDGAWLATSGFDETVRIWDPASDRELRTLTGHTSEVTALAFSPDGTWLATTSNDQTVRIWDPALGRELHTLTRYTDGVTAVAFSPNGSWLATAGFDRKVRIWDSATGRELHTLTGHTSEVTALAFSPDGTWLATTSNDQTVRIWSPATGMVLTMMRTNSRLFSCAWTPDGHALLVGGLEGLFGYRLFPGSPGV